MELCRHIDHNYKVVELDGVEDGVRAAWPGRVRETPNTRPPFSVKAKLCLCEESEWLQLLLLDPSGRVLDGVEARLREPREP